MGSQKVPGKSLGAIASYAKANPGKVTIGGSNVLTQLLGEQFRTLAGVDIQYIPFQGGSQQLQALLSGEIDFSVVGVMPYATYIRDGKLVGLATTGAKREGRIPDMPTVREAGFADLEGCNWLGLFAPAATPARIVERLNGEVAKALADPSVREKLSSSGLDPSPSTSAELADMVRNDLAKWKPIVEPHDQRMLRRIGAMHAVVMPLEIHGFTEKGHELALSSCAKRRDVVGERDADACGRRVDRGPHLVEHRSARDRNTRRRRDGPQPRRP